MNCLKLGHFVKHASHCIIARPARNFTTFYFTLITHQLQTLPKFDHKTPLVSSNTAANLAQDSLLMTCRVLVEASDGSTVKARALLDFISSASFVSECFVKGLCLPRHRRNATISGVAGLTRSFLQALTKLTISSTHTNRKFRLKAIIVPRVTCDLPVHPITFSSTWNHLHNLSLAVADFGCRGRVDLLLGIDIFTEALLNGRRIGPSALYSSGGARILEWAFQRND